MKKIAYILTTALMAGTLASCSLDSMSLTEKDTTNFPVNETDAAQALAAIYQNLNAQFANTDHTYFLLSLMASDDAYGAGGDNDKKFQAIDLLCNYQENMTEEFYKVRYQGINRANTLIEALESVEMNETLKNQSLGEAKFLRAFYYYELASMYNRVPLILTAAADEDPTPPAASVIWGQILQDLYEAASTMPATRRTDGHVDKYCAEALLGRAWLFYTGMFCNGEELSGLTSTSYSPLTSVELPNGTTLTKQDVIAAIDDCVNNSGYQLVSDFRNLWAYTNRYTVEDYDYTAGKGLKWVEDDNAINPESMFAVKFNKQSDWATTIGYANELSLFVGFRSPASYEDTFPFGAGWGSATVTPNLVADWKAAEPNDMRMEATIQDLTQLKNYTPGNDSWVQETGYYEKKLSPISCKNDGSQPDIDVAGNPYVCCFENLMYGSDGWTQGANNLQLNNIHDLVLIRFADVLLMQSELKESTDGINKVRARAGLPALSSYSLAALQNERRFELAFEGTRWNDIRRWHIAATALAKQENQSIYTLGNPDTSTPHNGGYAARYNATAGFTKIPENQISLSNGTLTQNPGWDGAESNYNGWR